MTIKTNSVLSSLKEAILNLQNEIETALDTWEEPIKNKIGTNWNPSKTDWRK